MKLLKSGIMNNSFVKINLVVVSILIITLLCFVTTEMEDCRQLNLLYAKIYKKEIDVVTYFRALNAYPKWRISSFIGIGITIILSFYLYLLLNSGININNNKNKLLFLFFWFCFFIVSITVLMAYNFWNWHYVSNDGGLDKPIFTGS